MLGGMYDFAGGRIARSGRSLQRLHRMTDEQLQRFGVGRALHVLA
jgi:hypothetical protein